MGYSVDTNQLSQVMTKRKSHNLIGVRFCKAEDDTIIKYVKSIGMDWEKISKLLGTGRTARSIQYRFSNNLINSNNSDFTEHEDSEIIEHVKINGKQWSYISKCMGNGRSPNSIKNRFLKLKSKIKCDKKLANSQRIKNIKKADNRNVELSGNINYSKETDAKKLKESNFEEGKESDKEKKEKKENVFESTESIENAERSRNFMEFLNYPPLFDSSRDFEDKHEPYNFVDSCINQESYLPRFLLNYKENEKNIFFDF
jgi:hypothetical protein